MSTREPHEPGQLELTHADIEGLLGAFALDAVDGAERDAVAEHLATCPRCRAEVGLHVEVAGALGNAGAAAPAGLWDRIAAEIGEELSPQVSPLPARRRHDGPRSRRAGWMLRVAAAAAVLVVAAVAVRTIRDQQREIDGLAEQVAAAVDRESPVDALADPASEVVLLEAPTGDLAARAVLAPDGTAYLFAEPLPDPGAGFTYQLWGLNQGTPVSLGVLGRAPAVYRFHVEGATVGLAITTEPAGGVTEPSGDPLVSADLA